MHSLLLPYPPRRSRLASVHPTKMTYYYQNQCDDICYSPCNYGPAYSYQSYDCGSPCGYRGYGGLWGYRDCYPSYSSRYCYPYSSYYNRRYSYGRCYPC
ncbi:keratin-associated protein 20-1-like isoform X1 [Phaenicophaeus curvirostris]|uniref:keratin-associated protein 20-1-like isoform X1 n=2 Tax=Phaenicophaeus curvirostris TaxID=33595 RepID=UPI0037F0EDB3